MGVADSVRQQSLHPFRDLPISSGWKRTEGAYVLACTPPLPIARVIEPRELQAGDVEAAVAEARAIVRANGDSLLIWWISPEHMWLGEYLERCGLVNEDTPGFESTENAMAIVDPPRGGVADDVHVALVDTFEDFVAVERVANAVFGVPGHDDDESLRHRYANYCTPGNPLREFAARLEDRVVGSAAAVVGDAGLNLFGGSVLPAARCRGVYRALIQARWELAVELGTRCLTVQAGRMSRPILERLGFEFLAAVHIYVDDLTRK